MFVFYFVLILFIFSSYQVLHHLGILHCYLPIKLSSQIQYFCPETCGVFYEEVRGEVQELPYIFLVPDHSNSESAPFPWYCIVLCLRIFVSIVQLTILWYQGRKKTYHVNISLASYALASFPSWWLHVLFGIMWKWKYSLFISVNFNFCQIHLYN